MVSLVLAWYLTTGPDITFPYSVPRTNISHWIFNVKHFFLIMLHNVDFCLIYTTLRKTYYKFTLLLSVWDNLVVLDATFSKHYINIQFIFTILLWAHRIDFILLVGSKSQFQSDAPTKFYVPNSTSWKTKFFGIFDIKFSFISSETKFPLTLFQLEVVLFSKPKL